MESTKKDGEESLNRHEEESKKQLSGESIPLKQQAVQPSCDSIHDLVMTDSYFLLVWSI